VEILDIAIVELDLREGGGDLGVGENAGGGPLREKELHLFELLQFRY